jgi:hypothetical protein
MRNPKDEIRKNSEARKPNEGRKRPEGAVALEMPLKSLQK